MKKIAFFCIPAHGHTNPMLPVAAELVRRGNIVRFYSFNEFEEKIKSIGADFIPCDSFLPKLTAQEEAGLKKVSTTEMTIQDIRITLNMDDFLNKEFASFGPDVVYTDSVCFWGKLSAWKHQIPMVVSTSTFAFNQMSSQYMKNSPKELADMVLGLPRISKELKKLEPYGYHVKNALSLVQSDNNTDSIVYTSQKFQPYAESFSEHYAFVGPSVFSNVMPGKEKERPLIYISMGTVINDRPDFYGKCIDALKDINADVIISCGNAMNRELLGTLPDNISVYPYVDQLDVLSKADVFITHCGMNSVSESLYMAAPMILYPQTGEQCAVARRVTEIGAGILLRDDSSEGIRTAVQEILSNAAYAKSAAECSADFRACSGTVGAAEFIENAPHTSMGTDVLSELNKKNAKFQLLYWLVVIAAILLTGLAISWKFVWVIGLAAGVLSAPVGKTIKKMNYKNVVENI
ncbi:MAG: glycosyl transferase [Lachnospiraceae bacterium]|nr:glycosyl transferase [Lachnospiraceae bacterium]